MKSLVMSVITTFAILYAAPIYAGPITSKECPLYITFETPEAAASWRAVNDGVMGGKSSGGPSFEGNVMIFNGIINTNGGGFSSVRTPMEKGVLAEASGLKLRVKSDGRAYKITLRTNARYRFRRISFQGVIPQTPAGEWAEVVVPFDGLKASLFGRPVSGAEFDRSEVVELGVIIADGTDGPFRLEIDWISACRKP